MIRYNLSVPTSLVESPNGDLMLHRDHEAYKRNAEDSLHASKTEAAMAKNKCARLREELEVAKGTPRGLSVEATALRVEINGLRDAATKRESQDKKRIAHVEKLKGELIQERRKSAKWEAAHSGLQAAYTGVCEAVDIDGAPWSGHPQDKPINYRAAMDWLNQANIELSLAKDAKADMTHAERVADDLGDDLRAEKAKAERLECETEQKVDTLKDEIAKLKDKEVEYQNIIGQRNGAVDMLVKALETKDGPAIPFASSMWANEMPRAGAAYPGWTEQLEDARKRIALLEASIVTQGEEAVKQQEEIEDLAKERFRLSLLVRDFREKLSRIREVSSDVYAPESERDF